MRFTHSLIAISALATAVIGCATHPGPPPQPVTRQVKVDDTNIADVQRAGYTVVNKDGQRVFCRRDPITGSRVQYRTTCLTEQEFAQQRTMLRNALERIQAPPQLSSGH